MARYWPWIVMALVALPWFAFWEVRAFRDGATTTTLSEALRHFTQLNPVFPYLVVAGVIALGVHLYVRW